MARDQERPLAAFPDGPLDRDPFDESLGLYLHVPFCAAICNYCNFNRGLLDEGLRDSYVRALAVDIRQSRAGLAVPADTIYFGGGTPSLLDPADIGRLIASCRDAFDVTPDAEITMEANPETVTRDRLVAYRNAGVTRVSFGVQSFRDDELRQLSRLHGAARARAAYEDARGAGFDNVSLDLMMWLPGQSVDAWLESVDAAIALGPEHLSLYLLEIYPNAPLKDEMARAGRSQAPDDDAAVMYLSGLDRLDAAGYRQYEISNVARAGRMSRHNLKYWTDGAWIGFGCGAHSTRAGVRTKNVSSTEEFVARVEAGVGVVSERRVMPSSERLGDALFTGLRLTAGIDMAAIGARYDVDVWERFGEELAPFEASGLLTRRGDRLALTREGMLVANEIMAVFV